MSKARKPLKEQFKDLKTLIRVLKTQKLQLTSFSISPDGVISGSTIPDYTDIIKSVEPVIPNGPSSFDEIPVPEGVDLSAALRNWDNPNAYAEGSLNADEVMKRQREADFDMLGYDIGK